MEFCGKSKARNSSYPLFLVKLFVHIGVVADRQAGTQTDRETDTQIAMKNINKNLIKYVKY